MSLFSSIRMASNTLQADQIAMQVVGQNIANANTDGYIREELLLTPGPTQKSGTLLLGSGVGIQGVVQKLDTFLEQRLRGSMSDTASYNTQQSAYTQLESLIGELGDTDISTGLTNFLSSVSEILNEPSDPSVRNQAVLQAQGLTETINHLASSVQSMRTDVNDQVVGMADQINSLVEQVRSLNLQIANVEGGNPNSSQAVGLRDQRLTALESLSKLINIRVQEQNDGEVAVYCGGTYLVYEGVSRQVAAVKGTVNGQPAADIQVVETQSSLNPSSGELHGLLTTRDDVLGGFLEKLDDFAGTLIYQFNKLYSGGQGLVGFEDTSSQYAVDSAGSPLSAAGLPFQPKTGSLQVVVRDQTTGITTTTDLQVKLNGNPNDTTLDSLADDLAKIDGLTVTTTATGKLEISAAAGKEFYYSGDTSGVLAALGLNSFFSGSTAADIGVCSEVAGNPALFAASTGGLGHDTQNAAQLADFLDYPLADEGGVSVGEIYDKMIAETAQASAAAQASAQSAQSFQDTLNGQKLSISGVSLDEETVNLMAFQQSFQASARYISVLQQMFEALMNI